MFAGNEVIVIETPGHNQGSFLTSKKFYVLNHLTDLVLYMFCLKQVILASTSRGQEQSSLVIL